MRTLTKAFSKDADLNRVLRGYADEYAGGMDKRRMIHFRCPNAETIKMLSDKQALREGGVEVDISYEPIADLRIHVKSMMQCPGDNSIWKTALDQTEHYDVASQISVAVSAPRATSRGEIHVKPMLIPRLR